MAPASSSEMSREPSGSCSTSTGRPYDDCPCSQPSANVAREVTVPLASVYTTLTRYLPPVLAQ